MRLFAELDETDTVLRVLVADDPDWLAEALGGTWVETFQDGTGRYASPGWTYHEGTDWRFAPPEPADGGPWTLDVATGEWTEE